MTELLEKLNPSEDPQLSDVLNRIELFQESMARLELQREDLGWQKLTSQGEREMSREGVIDRARFHRVFFAGNPIAKRGGLLRAYYVFGDGLGFSADSKRVNEVIQEHVDDPINRQVLFGGTALERLETANYTDGNIFIANPTNRNSGKVTHRVIPMEQITAIVTEPGDDAQVRYYVRRWTETDLATQRTVTHRVAYPHIRYIPNVKKDRVVTGLGGETTVVDWSTPVVHVAPNRQEGQQWGMADILPVVPWIEKHKEFLLDWAQLVKALQTVAWEIQGSRSDQAAQMRAQADQLGDTPAGSTAVLTGEGKLQAVSKSGATIDSDSAKPLLAQVAAGLGVPLTILSNDPGQVGSHNTAETLNPPMRKGYRARQSLWGDVLRQITEYVILCAAEAPYGKLRHVGTIEQRQQTKLLHPKNDGESLHVTIDFPSLDEHDITTFTEALARVESLDVVPHEILLREALRAIGVKQVDEVVEKMTKNGVFVPASAQVAQAAGQAAMDAFRRGEDPSNLLNGNDR